MFTDEELYKYRGTVLRAVDGDTIEVMISSGMQQYTKVHLRIIGFDTVEKGDENYKLAKEFTHNTLAGKEVDLITYKDKKSFDRYLADVWYEDNGKWINFNEKIKQNPQFLKIDSQWNK